MMVFWWGLVIVLVLAVFKWFQGQNAPTTNNESALDILKKGTQAESFLKQNMKP